MVHAALAHMPKQREWVDAGRMAIAPRELHGISANWKKIDREYVSRHREDVKQLAAGHLLDAGRAGALNPQLPVGIAARMAVRPFDDDIVHLKSDFFGYEHSRRRLCRDFCTGALTAYCWDWVSVLTIDASTL